MKILLDKRNVPYRTKLGRNFDPLKRTKLFAYENAIISKYVCKIEFKICPFNRNITYSIFKNISFKTDRLTYVFETQTVIKADDISEHSFSTFRAKNSDSLDKGICLIKHFFKRTETSKSKVT